MSVYHLLLPAMAYVLLACVCRLAIMSPDNSRVLWRLVYVLLAAWTGWVAADLAELGTVTVRDAMGVLAMALYMHMTRSRWAEGVPEVARS